MHTLIDELLIGQSKLQTPVAKFAEIHDRLPDLEPHYRQLIPLEKPAAGQQYAFEVSLDRCTGCKACVSACHSLNGLDEDESWRDVGTLVGGKDQPRWQQTVTTACHHCEDPGCMNGCPVGAYEKEDDTGIVRHLDDQCIGCSYCILKCPYDVPKYSKKRGIVRKCDMCHQRLAEGEAPACVQACPTEAIRIVTVSKSDSMESAEPLMEGQGRCSAMPDADITRPTTRYTGRVLPDTAHAADRSALVVQETHWPLVLMLVLTQTGLGLALAACLGASDSAAVGVVGAVLFAAGMLAAVFHLGQPLKAWRFFLGLKTSWLSREILAFSLIGPLPFLLAAMPWLPEMAFKPTVEWGTRILLPLLALLAVFTSVMIYHDTRRELWRIERASLRFYGTLFLACLLFVDLPHTPLQFGLLMMGKLVWECLILRHRDEVEWAPDAHSARLMAGPLKTLILMRGLAGVLAVAAAFIQPWLALVFLLGGELLERLLFFRAVCAPKMPGNFGPQPAMH